MPEITESANEGSQSGGGLLFRMCPDCGGKVEYYEHGTVYCRECEEQFAHIVHEVDGEERHRIEHRERGAVQEVSA